MDNELQNAIQSAVGGTRGGLVNVQPVSGGCIHRAWRATFGDGQTVFVKSNQGSDDFAEEVAGLDELRSTNTIRVPRVLAVGRSGGANEQAFLVLDWIEQHPKTQMAQARLGRQLAQLHQFSVGDQFGFYANNYLGSTLQVNERADNWIEFWAVHRIEFQLRQAFSAGFEGQLQSLGQKLIGRLESILSGTPHVPALLHGDLWSGNWTVAVDEQPVIFDPAVYWGCREAEFGMMTLFGDFSSEFFAAYQEAYPLAAGWEDRVAVYRLYHLLNHLNLFGSGYLGSCIELMKAVL